MATTICPKCGIENPASAMNCKNCGVNLKYALEHLDEMEFARKHPELEFVGQQAVQDVPAAPDVQGETEANHRKPGQETEEQLGYGEILLLITLSIVFIGGVYMLLVALRTGDTSFLRTAALVLILAGSVIGPFIGRFFRRLFRERQQ